VTPPVDEFTWMMAPVGRVLVCPALEPFCRHVFTTRDISFAGETGTAAFARLADSFGASEADLVRVRQVHGRRILHVSPDEPHDGPAEADAIVSTDPRRVITVRVADCVPIVLADRRQRSVAAVHAGWRGTAAGIAAATVEAMRASGVDQADLVAAVGASIGPCCYQVDERVRAAFEPHGAAGAKWLKPEGPGAWRLDLWAANRDQLAAAGVPAEAIHMARRCTAHHPPDWFSHRREGPAAGRMMAAVAFRI
jgi:YfiH family protein